jgi:hypothetical protein
LVILMGHSLILSLLPLLFIYRKQPSTHTGLLLANSNILRGSNSNSSRFNNARLPPWTQHSHPRTAILSCPMQLINERCMATHMMSILILPVITMPSNHINHATMMMSGERVRHSDRNAITALPRRRRTPRGVGPLRIILLSTHDVAVSAGVLRAVHQTKGENHLQARHLRRLTSNLR